MSRRLYRTDSDSVRNIMLTEVSNPASTDAFGRTRTSQPVTLFDSKQISNVYESIFFNDVEASGSGTGSDYSANRASYTLSVTAETAGKRIRQTKQRFNYQPGKSQLILITGVFGNGAAGITKRVGYFDENNGLGLKLDENGASFFIRSNVTGTPADTEVAEVDWETDYIFKELGIQSVDFTKSQIFFIDFEWLGVGSIRFGFVIDGYMIICHQQNNANNLNAVYMSTPNLPVRYELENDGTGAADTLETICSSVMSEGGQEDTGITRYVSNGATQVDANVAGTVYALVGVRLKAANLGQVVKVISTNVMCTANPNFEWLLLLNPTVADTFTYGDVASSAIQLATGATANTVTGGTTLAGGYTTSENAAINLEKSLYYLGSAIDGARDEIVLCARPLANSADIFGGITIREFS